MYPYLRAFAGQEISAVDSLAHAGVAIPAGGFAFPGVRGSPVLIEVGAHVRDDRHGRVFIHTAFCSSVMTNPLKVRTSIAPDVMPAHVVFEDEEIPFGRDRSFGITGVLRLAAIVRGSGNGVLLLRTAGASFLQIPRRICDPLTYERPRGTDVALEGYAAEHYRDLERAGIDIHGEVDTYRDSLFRHAARPIRRPKGRDTRLHPEFARPDVLEWLALPA